MTRTLSTLVMSPLIIFGFKEETQHIPVEVFSSYEDDQENPVTDVFVEIQSKQIQFYSVTLHIIAHFTGLRYIMFHWPILSASIGKIQSKVGILKERKMIQKHKNRSKIIFYGFRILCAIFKFFGRF